jgi:hypothetical protein
MRIIEPVTMLSDYALAGISLIFAARLFREGQARLQTSIRLWSATFVATATASAFGGSYHGLSAYLSGLGGLLLWKFTIYSLGLTSLLMLSGAIVAAVTRSPRRLLLAAAGLKFAVYAVWMVTHNDFRFVIYDYAVSMLGVLSLQAWIIRRRPNGGAYWIAGGVLISFGAAGVQMAGFDLHPHFNHNDLYHLIQMFALYLLYKGGLAFHDAGLQGL